ncbi:MucR family transcriptional regulator [Sphingomonas colocasiae]|uniref:MucR family transcriptional regulator n=1 Tax=Sphingomonas colocasiae TaxID=1848973 RepID=A0ABS7PR99_9SPHN|nr:MucR family transcriptional regulator [Sphingomonas colocasiae]MBY8823200.1 MucR family transcriptional regulator [Sphingomonas colocasiae]
MSDTDHEIQAIADGINPVELAADLTMAWLSNPNTRASAEDVPSFLKTMHAAVAELGAVAAPSAPAAETAEEFTPAVTVRKSLGSRDHIISMIDGKPYRTLRRHLSTHGLTPEQYRERYNLKPDYPMVAETYSEARRAMAKKIGLGRKPGEKAPAKAAPRPAKAEAAKPAARKSPSAARKAAQKHLSGDA